MADDTCKIVVAGDVAIDWLQFTVPAGIASGRKQPPMPNWRLRPGTGMVARSGGALLLARMVREAAQIPVATHPLEGIETIPPQQTIHSIVQLDRYPSAASGGSNKDMRFRVQRKCGFAGPVDDMPVLRPVDQDNPDAEMVILDDAGNGFRDMDHAWPQAVTSANKRPIILHKMSRPIFRGKLWQAIRRPHAERMVVVVGADDLRAEGVNISYRLSWERTAKDFVWQLACNPGLRELARCQHLIVRFGIDAAIYTCLDQRGAPKSTLFYDPMVAEDGFRDNFPGQMIGFNAAFVAALAARMVSHFLSGISDGVRDGILASRRLCHFGFGRALGEIDYPCAAIFRPWKGDVVINDIRVPNPTAVEPADPGFWSILAEPCGDAGDDEKLFGSTIEEMAYAIVEGGDKALAMQGAPVGRFGILKTVDRAEIENFRSITNLIREYIDSPDVKRPLSIAVFGPPGSGKSFGVTQVAKVAAPGLIKTIEFNVSQFQAPEDLVKALHKVRDIVLEGRMPLVFFDEFDSSASFGGNLGWLKYFLAPMQDGKFRDGETFHPIGRSLFVFAGGTSKSLQEFSGHQNKDIGTIGHEPHHPEENGQNQKNDARATGKNCKESLPIQAQEDQETREQLFINAKGPDFVSRLRGYVNIKGVNPSDPDDRLFMIRRAIILRTMMERFAKQVIEDGTERVRIDPGVLRALIKIPEFKHGARSMEAILDMSLLAGRECFEQASLPSAEQLKLHVDAEMFMRLVARDVLFGSARELLAQAIHEQYRIEQKDNKPPEDAAMQPWDKLAQVYKESNRQQADQIPEKLRVVQCAYMPLIKTTPQPFSFTIEEVEKLAEMEHDRWIAERRLDGWVLGPERDKEKKISPYLVAWEDLPDSAKEWDRNAVINVPEIMARAGFQIYRLTS